MTGTASAPASSANLGPGFDALAIALDLRCHVRAQPSDAWEIFEKGQTIIPKDSDLVVRAAASAVDQPMLLTIDNDIPRARGLGSSAAVTAAATCAAVRAMGGEPSRDDVFAIVTELEGHSDNAAAAVYGGLVIAMGNTWRALPLSPSLRFVVGIPDQHLSTQLARAALPETVPFGAAGRNVARVGMLIEGLRTGDAGALAMAAGDELHEKHRADLSPLTGAVMQAAVEAGAFHAAWSGAGPAALVVTDDTHIEGVVAATEKALDGAGKVLVLDVAADGLL